MTALLMARQFNSLQRNYSADDQAVKVRKWPAQFTRCEKVGDGKRVAKPLGGQGGHILRTWHPPDGVFEHDLALQK